ncbi:MAG: SOS response-associated peptidase family protein [Burkholderiales bacterium]|nr:SOS response-associated peptidase family protein [Burkholderiales bacterium]
MCNQYAPPGPERVAAYFRVAAPSDTYRPGIGPWGRGPFIRRVADRREAVVGQWALIGDNAREARSSARIMTNNARSETVASKPTFRGPWQRGQRCLIPADTFLEPNWELGKNVWWRFARADGEPWGLAGLWNRWTDPASGELVESYTMLTLNADAHPLMSRMHKPDPKLPDDQQDKRSVIAIEPGDFDTWLAGDIGQARALMQLTPVELFAAAPQG